ncbi:MAG: DUF2855 family protein [Solirubrobacterales bacterium]
MHGLLIKRDDLRQTRLDRPGEPTPGAGEASLAVKTFGMTANNVTYAVMGEVMSYWDFFPVAEKGWGRLPTWGFAEVEVSEVEGVEPGQRYYGYWPAASRLLVTPGRVDKRGFVDASPHRAELPSAYHGYLRTDADPFYRSDSEELQMLLRPLFFTSFLIDDQLADEGLADGGPVLMASASSKTALAAAFMLAQREGVEPVALTSERNVEFVEGLGIYARTVAYPDIESLDREPATFVDFAGNGEVRSAVHSHFGDELRHSMGVGVTHWEDSEGGADLLGPPSKFFFAPTRVTKRSSDWGSGGLEQRVADAWGPFWQWCSEWLEVDRAEGFEAARDAYLDVLEGRVPPSRATVLTV